jgi:hypothetical protein
MRKHTFLTKAASIAVCFGILLTNAASAFDGEVGALSRDIELSRDGALFGQICNSEGRALEHASVSLKYQGHVVASTVTGRNGEFVITGVRGGAHEMHVGSVSAPVRLWKNGTAPEGAVEGLVIAADENVVRGQEYDSYGAACPPTGSGFGLIDIVTLAMLGTSTAALIVAIDTNNELDDVQAQLPASP